MKKLIFICITAIVLSSCGVQQFCVNTETMPFQYGGNAFGEKTRGKVVSKKYELFVLGINVFNSDTKQMAEGIKATSYTIESKNNVLSVLVSWVTFGIVHAPIVKVIKRDK